MVMTGVLRLGKSQFVTSSIDEDSAERIRLCLRYMDNSENTVLKTAFIEDCKASYVRILGEPSVKDVADKKKKSSAPFDLLSFRLLKQEEIADDQVK